MNQFDSIVVGGGISGLSAAWKLQQQGKQVLVLEAEHTVGGCLQSVCFQGDGEKFCQELGAHSAFNSYGGLLEILASLESTPVLLAKQKSPFLLFQQGKTSKVTQKLNLIQLLFSVWRVFILKKSDKSIAEYYGGLVGKKNYQEVVRHALASVSCQNADTMPADFLFQKRHRDKKTEKKFSFEGGMSALVSQISKGLEVRNGCKVSRLQQEDKDWKVITSDAEYASREVVLAVPAVQAGKLLEQVNPALSQALQKISSTFVDSLAFMVERADTSAENCAGWIGVETDFYAMISTDPVHAKGKHRGFTFHFKPDLLSVEAQKQKACSVLGISLSQAIGWHAKRNTMPQITAGHAEKIDAVQRLLEAEPSLGLSGNYFTGMAIEDCIQRSFAEVARLAKNRVK